VQHRHLLPNEIDLLVDGESGFGVQPLREHLNTCSDCRARLTEAQEVVGVLSSVPLLAPRIGMAERVMTRVPVFVPWHIAARDTIRDWMPETPVARALAAVLVATVGAIVSGLTLFIATRGDLLATLTVAVGEQARTSVTDAFGGLVVTLFGPQVVGAVQQLGPLGIALAAGGFLIASAATVLGLRLIATSGRVRS
jgi:hypothetical protein